MRAHVGDVIFDADRATAAGRVLLEIAPDWRSTVSTDSLASLIAELSREVLWSPPTTVYQDMVNTGAVGVIRSDEVRLRLNELMESLAWVEGRALRHNDFFWTEMAGDPTRDVRALRRIRHVWRGGVEFDRALDGGS